MCEANKKFFACLPLALLFVFAAGALRAEEAPGRWYLISETELSNIERFKTKSEAEKQTWLLQARESKAQADSLSTLAENLLRESEILNSQLASQRELNRNLRLSFDKLEAGRLTLISTKNGEIAGLKQALADRTLEAESYKGKAALRLVIIIALAAGIVVFAGIKIFLKRFP